MSEIKSEFRTKLEEFKKEYEAERKGFNIFRALHKDYDEKYLHSRFISYLLSPTSQHGMGDLYLKLFIETLSDKYPNLRNFKIDNCIVQPNEEKKEEFKYTKDDETEPGYIDILISSEDGKQVIIIENKIFAKHSYHVTQNGEKIHQIDKYCQNEENKGKEVLAIYLAPHKRNPEEEGVKHKPIIVIEYQKEISEWLKECIKITDNGFLTEALYQYKSVVRSFTSNLERVKGIREFLDDEDKIIEAWKNKNYFFEKDKRNGKEIKQLKWGDFKHVQWHTIADFWNELADSIEGDPINAKINSRITIEEISGIVHKNWKDSYGITFELKNGQEWYIVNDNINGLSFGKIFEGRITLEQIDNILNSKNNEAYGICFILDDGKEWYITNDKIKSTYREKLEEMSKNKHRIKIWFEISKNIKFTDFSNEDTFMLINAKKRGKRIDEIINKLKENSLIKEPISIIL